MFTMSRKTVFNPQWRLKEKLSWVAPVERDPFSAKCILCSKIFSLSNMGERALTSHMEGQKHKDAVSASQSANIEVFCQKSVATTKSNEAPPVLPGNSTSSAVVQPSLLGNSASASVQSSSVVVNTNSDIQSKPKPKSGGIETMLLKDAVTKAEIIWCMKIVMSHESVSSGGKSVNVFSSMFPDSEIAKKMKLQRTKIAYTINFGLAPYFFNDLQDVCRECCYIVLGFDESLNKVAQKGQMDLSVRYWDPKKNQVMTRYYSSSFLGHGTSGDLLESFKEAADGLDFRKLLQVSMDGPNVNKKFIRELQAELCEVDIDQPLLLDLGTCGLHTVHNAYKTAMKKNKEWKLLEFLRALYYLFNYSPARREDYSIASGSTLFPLKFCAVRWVENFNVAERALKIMDHVRTYVEYIKNSDNKKKEPTCNSFKTVSLALQDKFLSARLAFFQTIASDIQPFLTQFQSDKPLAPLLFEELSSTLNTIMSRFIKDSVLIKASNIARIELDKKENFKDIKDIDVGFASRSALREIKPVERMQFYKECRGALIEFCRVLLTKSPLLYPLTKGISCFDPKVALQSKVRTQRLTTTLDYFVDKKRLSGAQADRIKRSYNDVCQMPLFDEKMRNFSKKIDRLDDLWLDVIPSHTDFSELRSFVKIVFILSHGNAFAERGFSINKEMLIENMSHESLIAQRKVYDAIMYYGSIDEIEINKRFILAARNAHSLYEDARKKKEELAHSEVKRKVEKRKTDKMVEELEKKKKIILDKARDQVANLDSEIKKLI